MRLRTSSWVSRDRFKILSSSSSRGSSFSPLPGHFLLFALFLLQFLYLLFDLDLVRRTKPGDHRRASPGYVADRKSRGRRLRRSFAGPGRRPWRRSGSRYWRNCGLRALLAASSAPAESPAAINFRNAARSPCSRMLPGAPPEESSPAMRKARKSRSMSPCWTRSSRAAYSSLAEDAGGAGGAGAGTAWANAPNTKTAARSVIRDSLAGREDGFICVRIARAGRMVVPASSGLVPQTERFCETGAPPRARRYILRT